MTRRINAAGLSHIQQWEGKRLTAYQDVAGIWTIGYGHTSATSAPKVVAGMKISEQEAVRILRADLGKFEKRVSDLVKVPLFYALGAHDSKQQAALKAAQAVTQAIQNRAGINEILDIMDSVALCVELGGLRDQCEQLRGMAEDQP